MPIKDNKKRREYNAARMRAHYVPVSERTPEHPERYRKVEQRTPQSKKHTKEHTAGL